MDPDFRGCNSIGKHRSFLSRGRRIRQWCNFLTASFHRADERIGGGGILSYARTAAAPFSAHSSGPLLASPEGRTGVDQRSRSVRFSEICDILNRICQPLSLGPHRRRGWERYRNPQRQTEAECRLLHRCHREFRIASSTSHKRSLPKHISAPTRMVGAPKVPRAIDGSVLRNRRCLTAGSSIRKTRPRPLWRAASRRRRPGGRMSQNRNC
jgi:hypothetical protein